MEFTALTPTHGDVVNDISFDFYGKRFATCSSDKDIKVWDLVNDSSNGTNNGQDTTDHNNCTKWQEVTIPRAHQDSIWRISWAHPEFGQLFASCSLDKTVHIWEEQEGVSKSENRDKWIRKMQLSDSKGSVNDVKFGPRHVGLKLASGSADGCIRIYEATDVFALNYWSLQSTITANIDSSLGVSGSGSGSNSAEDRGNAVVGVNCLAWNECPFEPPYIVAGYAHGAILWTERGGKWTEEMRLSQDHSVYDVAWAAGMGRSYHLIATVDRTRTFKVYKIRREGEGKLAYDSCLDVEAPSNVWRVAWNATGTVLATSTENGDLDLWRRDFKGNWVSVQSIPSSIPSRKNFFNVS